MSTSIDCQKIRLALLRWQFEDITSSGRSTKTWKLKHSQMQHHVSLKRGDNDSKPTTTLPLVIHPDDARKAKNADIAGVFVASDPYQGGSTKYNGPGKEIIAGFGVNIESEPSLDELIGCLTSPVALRVGDASAKLSPAKENGNGEGFLEPPASTMLAAAQEIDEDPTTMNEPETVRRALVDARLGQGSYRRQMMQIWDGKCAVTGCTQPAALIASHAKPWKESTNAERLDPYNGLLLTASIDRLFDRGLIAFDDEGQMLQRVEFTQQDRLALGLSADSRLRRVDEQHRSYLAAHRQRFKF